MKKYVITISREFAAMGRTIAQRLSDLLEIGFWDRDIVETAAKRLGQSISVISEAEERAGYSLLRYRKEKISLTSYNISDEIFRTESSIIQDAANQDSCIIVGRCADYILRDHPNHLSVFLYAPYEKRLENCVHLLGMSEKEARKTIRDMDLARRYYQKKYSWENGSLFAGKDLMIDSSRFGIEDTAKLIAGVARLRFDA